VRLKRLTLENFRGFESLDLELDPQLTVLVGANGAGKTSILDALVLGLSKAKMNRTTGHPWADSDQRKGATTMMIALEMDGDEDSSVTRQFRMTKTVGSGSVGGPVIPANFKICAYSVRREVGPVSSQPSTATASLLDLWRSKVDFSEFFAWFIAVEDIENERRRDSPDYRDVLLEPTRNAVERLLPGYTSLRVRRSPSHQPSLSLVKGGVEFNLEQLSEGERALAVLAGDIAWRTAVVGQGHCGIVIIDEIDLHLHPKWQASVLPSLLRTFPDLQFIVTTHSPIVLSHVDTKHVRLLENFRLVDVPPTRGRDPNSVLTEVFGIPLRPAETQAHIDRIAELIDEEQLDEAKQELRRLGDQLGSSDLEVTRLRGLVELMEA